MPKGLDEDIAGIPSSHHRYIEEYASSNGNYHSIMAENDARNRCHRARNGRRYRKRVKKGTDVVSENISGVLEEPARVKVPGVLGNFRGTQRKRGSDVGVKKNVFAEGRGRCTGIWREKKDYV